MKLITWNTQWCCGLDGRVSPQRIVEQARDMADFDVLCLQEIAQGYDGLAAAPGDQPAQLAALLPGFQLFFGAAVDEFTADGRRQRFGNLIATRLPPAQVQHHALPWPADPAVASMPRMCTVLTVLDPGLGALRVMCTHLEYYSAVQRLAQAQALRALHAEACARAAAPPLDDGPGTPFQAKRQTAQAILCGDFNCAAGTPAYAALCRPFDASPLRDAWPWLHPGAPQPPTFRLFDHRYGADPMACDFVFVSDALAPKVRRVEVDARSQASDHQPVLIELAA
jgi:endonuclease/exonuclease/phosphatase family metal-dependent hydrolase